ESTPEPVAPGGRVWAGAMNLTGPLVVRLVAHGEDTFLSEVIRLMAAAEQSRSAYVRIADRLAGLYAPTVHVLAGATLLGWLFWSGFDWPLSLLHAISVLIITCPCALGLAVPAVQVVAAGVLFRNGVMVKDGAALERLAEIDTVIFDKTGTLTLGRPRLLETGPVSTESMAVAAGLARGSGHPLSRALLEAVEARGIDPEPVRDVREHPGRGLEGVWRGRHVRLGSREFCDVPATMAESDMPQIALAVEGRQPVLFTFADTLRPDAAATIRRLKEAGLKVEMISGDREGPVRAVARELGIDVWRSGWTPQQKLAYVEGLAKAGARVLMVGDGINDAPALAAGHASMAPSTASDIGRTAADMVFLGHSLAAVWLARVVALRARRLMTQNFAMSLLYNVLAVPVAVLGFATPLFAAIAMSASSIVVVGNSLRLGFVDRRLRRGFALDREREEAATTDTARRRAA
ncbi:MAG TPA: heavy metal translocating P-type ATPase, partial [Thermopetrobacter sp.]|nr:heavy metal translocating P-type ATPase [Thermopetrobacter sp.]